MNAQALPVPSAFQDLYTSLNDSLVLFNSALGSGRGSTYPTLMTGSLQAANGNIGPQLLKGAMGMQLQLNALKAMGVKAVMVEVGFPVLYEPFLTGQGQSYPAFAAYYQGVATAVRQAGLKLIVENDTLPANKVLSGWDAAPFYATLDWTQYRQARAQMALTIAHIMQPDYLVVLEEPDTEAGNTGQSDVNTPTGAAAMLSQMLGSVQQAGISNLKVGAGVGTWLPGYLGFIQDFVTLPVDFIDMHIYPVTGSYLSNALEIASVAAAAGKPVSMTECWLSKVRASELNMLSADQVRSRDTFSFWGPLDTYFIQTMENLANHTQMLFLDPFRSEYYFAYLLYDDSTMYLLPPPLLAEENAAAAKANLEALYTSTGLSYYSSVVAPPDTTPPSPPSGLTGTSGSPTTVTLNWIPANDNVGVAGYYVIRNGQVVGTAATTFYQDSGLVDTATYTYVVEAFDLAGNVSAPSNPLTQLIPPPLPHINLVARAVACTRIILTWSPPAGIDVMRYSLFVGQSPGSISPVIIAPGTTTTFVFTATPATTYYFFLQAEDKSGNLYMSPAVAVTTPALPGAPANLSATPNSTTKVTLTWSPSTGGLPIAYYLVYRGNSPSGFSEVARVINTWYTDRTLTAATTYYYAVQAVDTGKPPSQSGISGPVAVTTFSPPPAPVLTVTRVSCTKAILTWSAVSGGLPIASYRVYRGTSPSSFTQLAATTKTSYTDAARLGGVTYYYAVQAVDTAGDSSPMSNPVSVAPCACPSAPSNLVATALSANKVGLTWSPSTGGLPIAHYTVYRGIAPGSLFARAISRKTSFIDTSVASGSEYYYAVQATDTAMDVSPPSGPVAVTTF